MISPYSPGPFDQPQILIVSANSTLRIELARLITRLKALALVVLDLSVPEVVLSSQVALAIVDDQSPSADGMAIARALWTCDPALPVVLLRDQAASALAPHDNATVVRQISELRVLIPELVAEHEHAGLLAPRW